MTRKDNPRDENIDMDQDQPIDLKGSEQHHKLKNQDGEQGDPEHADGDTIQSDEINEAVADGDGDTAIWRGSEVYKEDFGRLVLGENNSLPRRACPGTHLSGTP